MSFARLVLYKEFTRTVCKEKYNIIKNTRRIDICKQHAPAITIDKIM